jgi:hypothetical protein
MNMQRSRGSIRDPQRGARKRSTAPQVPDALRHTCQFERVVEHVSFTPITGLLAGNRFLRICARPESTRHL